MYHPKRVLERIEAISKATNWIPEYHSMSEIDSFNKHVQSLQETTNKGTFQKREFNYDELAWINNEYSLCASDFRYWLTNYAHINAGGEIRRFELRASQEMLLELWAEREEKNLQIEQIILKARQQGISTIVELAITHRVNFGLGVNAVVASAQADMSERMAGMMQLAYNEMPYWMQAVPTSDRAGSLMAFGGNSTRLNIYSGRSVSGIARGDTPSAIHLSEVCEMPNAASIIENSLFNAVHPSPRVFMILESTGNGNVGWWADTWYSSRDHWHSGGARLQPVFFPWFIASDLFPTITWRRGNPLPALWSPLPETERMMVKCAAYVRMTPLMRRFLGEGWELDRHQAYWWETKYLEAKRKGNAKGWFQEMPVDDIEALQPKKDLVFDLEAVEEQFQGREEYSVWSITGEQIMEKFHPAESEVDYLSDRFRVTYKGIVHDINGRSPKDLIWEFIPNKQPTEKGNQFFDADCKLIIFRWPEEGYDYSVGVDTANGGSGDNTVISVNRRSLTGRDPDVQVAEFASNKVSSAEAHAFVLAIATLYAQEMPGTEPLVAVEQVRGPGDNVQLQMKMHGYKRFYKFSRMDGKHPKQDQKKSKREGWYTYSWSRDFLLDIYKHAVENGWRVINSPFLLRQEIPSFQIDQTSGGKVRYDHESGKHDDRIFADAISYIIFNDTESMSKRVERKFLPAPDRLPEINLATIDPLAVPYNIIAEGFDQR